MTQCKKWGEEDQPIRHVTTPWVKSIIATLRCGMGLEGGESRGLDARGEGSVEQNA